MKSPRWPRALAFSQGAYFFATGLWPVLHLRSFAKVTGPKPEGWLVKTTGLLIANIGWMLMRAARAGVVTQDTRALAVGSAFSLAAVDLWYAGVRGRISPVYLLDAPLELGLCAAWMLTRAPPAAPRRSLPVLPGTSSVEAVPDARISSLSPRA